MTQTTYMLDLLDQTEYATGADASHWKGEWHPEKVDMDLFQSVMDFVVIRAGYGASNGQCYEDKKFRSRWDVLLKYPHMLRGVYWYFSSHIGWAAQFAFFVKIIEGLDMDFIVLDFEKYYNEKSKSFAAGAVFFMEALKHKFPGKQIIFYSNRYDYQDWMKRYHNGADNFPLWLAQYHAKNWVSNFTEKFKNYWRRLIVEHKEAPTMPYWLPQDHWEIWQIIDASGIGHELGFDSDELDFNVSRRKKDSFIEWIGVPERWGIQPNPEPEPEPDQKYEKGFAAGRMHGLAEALEYLGDYVEEHTS